MIRIERFDRAQARGQAPDAVVVSASDLIEWVEGVMEGQPAHAEELLEDMRGALLRLAPPPAAGAYVRRGRPCESLGVADEGGSTCEGCGWEASWHSEEAQAESRAAAKAQRLDDALEDLDEAAVAPAVAAIGLVLPDSVDWCACPSPFEGAGIYFGRCLGCNRHIDRRRPAGDA